MSTGGTVKKARKCIENAPQKLRAKKQEKNSLAMSSLVENKRGGNENGEPRCRLPCHAGQLADGKQNPFEKSKSGRIDMKMNENENQRRSGAEAKRGYAAKTTRHAISCSGSCKYRARGAHLVFHEGHRRFGLLHESILLLRCPERALTH